MSYYRVHSATESLETILDVNRPDGWVASDEDGESQPTGVSCCESLAELIAYCREYGMSIRPTDRIVRVEGSICDDDRDSHAVRVAATSYRVVGSGKALARMVRNWSLDVDRASALMWHLEGLSA